MTPGASSRTSAWRRPLLIAVAWYLLFVVYCSFVPLDFHRVPLDLAWRTFMRARYLDLGVGARADWVANILLYIPLAYLMCASLAGGVRSMLGRLAAVVAVFAACAAVAIGVEFAQLYFPPRTVSLNDIVAEWIGSAIGIGAWLAWGGALERLWTQLRRGGRPAQRAAVVAYVLAYVAFGLFPYDFLVSSQEFAEKFAGGGYGLFAAPGNCDRFSRCALKFIAETIAVAPLGVLLSMTLGPMRRRVYVAAALGGLALGVVLELTQLLLASGISEGMSIVTRVIGMCLGVAVHRNVHLKALGRSLPLVGPALWLGIPLYLLALMWANAWFSARWLSLAQARAGLADVHWLPFYYHYYTTETHALRSLVATLAMYLPVGFGYWLGSLRAHRSPVRGSATVPVLIAAALSATMEAGKLVMPGKHPDPTDVLIAMAAAAASYHLSMLMHRWALQGEPVPATPRRAPDTLGAGSPAVAEPSRWLPALLLLVGVGVAIWSYPLSSTVLAGALAVYAALLWRRPGVALPALLVLLPLLDLSPWTGWVLVNEFDLVVATTLVVRLLRPRGDGTPDLASPGFRWVAGLLAASFVTSALVGALPLSPLDANAVGSYFTSYNSLRALKGFAWALALAPLLIEELRDRERMERRWIGGMLGGLCAVVAVVVWQRAAFVGILNFAIVYRVEGTFPELHTGGGDIHAYLVMAVPFVIGWFASRPTLPRLVSGALLFVAASYALGVTFARGGYVGYAGALLVAAAGIAIAWWRKGRWTARRLGAVAAPSIIAVVVMAPIVSGAFMEARLAGTQAEAATRARHWARAIDMMDASATTRLFGMGLGSYPRAALFNAPDAASATFRFEHERDNGFVRLGSGTPAYLDQRVRVAPHAEYTLSLDLRSREANAVPRYRCARRASCTRSNAAGSDFR